MFGYVKANKPRLRICEYDTYKAIYCSLCKKLGKDYGFVAQMILSYDFTFLAMIRLGISGDKVSACNMRCSYNPLKKCNGVNCKNDELNYVAACAIMLFYYKLIDNLHDTGLLSKIKSAALLPFFKHYRKKAIKRYKELDRLLEDYNLAQSLVEENELSSLDQAAEPSAKVLSHLFTRDFDTQENKRVLSQLGYLVGKWIYLIDAYDDLDSDINMGGYNPISLKAKNTNSEIEEVKESVSALINVCNTQAAASLQLLDLNRFLSILENILYEGMPLVLKSIKNPKPKNDRRFFRRKQNARPL